MRAGVDLGGTKVQAVVVDARNRVRGQARLETPKEGGPPAVAAQVAEAVGEAAAEAKTNPARLTGIGIGAPGDVQPGGVVASAPNLAGWDAPFPLGPAVTERLGVPVVLGNDVQVATSAEFHLGAGKPYQTILGVFWGTGVGGGIVLDGRDWTGRGAAAEIGHVVVKIDGARCGCGRRGCMEAYAGRACMEAKARRMMEEDGRETKLFEIAEKRGRDRLTSGIWSRAAEAGDEVAIHLLDRAVKALGAGVASVCNVIDPEAVIIGGGLGVRFGDEYVERIRAAMMPHLFADDRPPAILLAALGDLGGAIGAALLAGELNGDGSGSARRPGTARPRAARRR